MSFLSKTVLLSSLTLAVCQVNAQSLLDASYISLKVGSSHTSANTQVHDTAIHNTDYMENGSVVKSYNYDDSSDTTIKNNKNKVLGAIAYGIDLSKVYNLPIRTEIEYSTLGKSTTNGLYNAGEDAASFTNTVRSQTLFLNGYYDFKNTSKFTPYLTAGLGMAFNKVNNTTHYDDEDVTNKLNSNNFAWNVGAGVAYEFMPNTSLDLSYRFVNAGKTSKNYQDPENGTVTHKWGYGSGITITDNNSTDYKTTLKSHNVMLGLRYTF